MLRKNYDKIIFTLTLLVLIGFSAVFFQRGEQIAAELDTEIPPVRNVYDYEMTREENIEIETITWGGPGPQSSGVDWVYDIFTPPEIFYHEAQDRFDVRPPGPVDEDAVVAEVEFVGFEEEPYRIQLTGHAGRDDDPLIFFQDREAGGVLSARTNQDVPEADMEVRSFTVHRRDTDGVVTRVSEVVIYDRRTGEEVLLEEEETKYLDEPAIVVSTNETPPRTINARPGEAFDVGDFSYRVENYTVDPPEINITKTAVDQDEPRRATLSPGERF